MSSCARSLQSALAASAASGQLADLLAGLSWQQMETLLHDWPIWARDDQLPPGFDEAWTVWLLLGGRGAGKTRAGAEWVRGMALGRMPFSPCPVARIALVGETLADVRDVMVEGISGLLAIHPKSERPLWQPSRRRLQWPNGAVAQIFSAEDPEGLRGPQFDCAWADELAKWRYGEETWDMLQFGLRLGDLPRQVVTTTPRNIPLLKMLIDSPSTRVSRAGTRANISNLAPGFMERVVGRYAGTRLGRQELDGELIEDRPDALWQRDMIEHLRVKAAPQLSRVVVAVDPPATSGKCADACGICVAGLGEDGSAYLLKDGTIQGQSPKGWAERAVSLYHRFAADCLLAEVNQGGEMVSTILNEVDPSIPVQSVHATRGKYVRAEPVAALYEQGRVHHVGTFCALEDEMCDFGLGGLSSGKSPDRMDALVWALTSLLLGAGPKKPRVRSF